MPQIAWPSFLLPTAPKPATPQASQHPSEPGEKPAPAPQEPQETTVGRIETPPAAREAREEMATLVPPALSGDGNPDPKGGMWGSGPHQRVALLLPLSGTTAGVGQALLNSAQMALFERTGSELVLQVYDTKGTPEGAVQAAGLALSQGVRLIIGPVFSPEVKAVAPQAHAVNVNVIAFTGDPATASGGVFVLGHQLRQQVERVTAFARSRGLAVFAALAPDNEYGRQAVAALRQTATALDGRITAVEFYDPATDPTPVVKRLARQKPFDAVLIPDTGQRLKNVAPLLPYFDIDVQETRLLGTQLWSTGDGHHEPATVGGWYAAPVSPDQARFAERYRQLFNAPPSAIASLAYDAVALAAVLAEGPAGPNFDSGVLTGEAGFAGVDGLFRLRPSGITERGLAVMEIKADGPPVLISPPPESFDHHGF